MKRLREIIKKAPKWLLYSLPSLVIFTIILFAYYPGIVCVDTMFQWHQVQTGSINDWHPAYTTIIIWLLTRIWNSTFFVLLIQIVLISMIFGYSLSVIEKRFNINKKTIIISSFIFPVIPINFNYSVLLIKDTVFSFLVLLLTICIIELIYDKDYFKKKNKSFLLFISLLGTMLFRYNGIFLVIPLTIVLCFVYFKNFRLYSILFSSIIVYVLMTTIGLKVLNIEKGNPMNKYGPISHIIGRMLNDDNISFSKKELSKIEKYVDVEQLKETFDPFNMDYSINSQKIDYIKAHSSSYVGLGLKLFMKHPLIVIKHYIYLDSYLYSPYPFPGQMTAGLFVDSDLWVYTDSYPELKENSKLPWLLNIIKQFETDYHSGAFSAFTTHPALYMYFIIFALIYLSKKLKEKKLLLVMLPMLFNTLSLAIAIPIGMARYIYATLLIFYFLFIIWFDYKMKNYGKIK